MCNLATSWTLKLITSWTLDLKTLYTVTNRVERLVTVHNLVMIEERRRLLLSGLDDGTVLLGFLLPLASRHSHLNTPD